jgi:hypothetical protein
LLASAGNSCQLILYQFNSEIAINYWWHQPIPYWYRLTSTFSTTNVPGLIFVLDAPLEQSLTRKNGKFNSIDKFNIRMKSNLASRSFNKVNLKKQKLSKMSTSQICKKIDKIRKIIFISEEPKSNLTTIIGKNMLINTFPFTATNFRW